MQRQFDAMVQELEQANVSVAPDFGHGGAQARCPDHPGHMLVISRIGPSGYDPSGFPDVVCTSRDADCAWWARLWDVQEAVPSNGQQHSVDAGAASPAPKPKPRTPEPGVWQQEQWQRAVSNDSRVTGGCLGVALLISTEARRVDGTRAMISNERIAKAFAIDKSTVKRHTQRLRQLGYLKVTHKGHRRGDGLPTANVYDLCLPDSQGLTHEP